MPADTRRRPTRSPSPPLPVPPVAEGPAPGRPAAAKPAPLLLALLLAAVLLPGGVGAAAAEAPGEIAAPNALAAPTPTDLLTDVLANGPAPGTAPAVPETRGPAGASAPLAGGRTGTEPRLPRRRATDAPRLAPTLSRLAAGRADGHVVVRFAPGISAWQGGQVAQGLGGGAARPARHGGFTRVEVPQGTTPEELVARLAAHPSVLWAETDPLVRAAYLGVEAAGAAVLTDPLFPLQWHLHRIGAEEALERNPTDGAGVLVAVIDSGVAYGDGTTFPRRPAPDLENTDFAPGFDFFDDDDEPFDEGTGDPDAPLTSLRFGHGTFAASVIAAQVNNGLAGSSVAPRVTILPVRVLGSGGFGSTSDVAEGIRFAAERGARVINLSLGATRGSNSIREAVADAHRRGVVLVAAAGNEAEEGLFDDELGRDVAFPARYPEVLAVGATNFAGERASYSNFGPSLDVMAPAGDGVELLDDGQRDGVLATSFLRNPRTGETLYGAFWSSGTSFAAPQVAGLAALLIALGVDDAEDVRRMIEGTTRDFGAEGFDETFGHGLIDAAAAHRGLGFTF